MLAGAAYVERRHQGAAYIWHGNICVESGQKDPGSKWETHPKEIENDRAKILWDFQIQTDKMMAANQTDIATGDKQDKKILVVDVARPK